MKTDNEHSIKKLIYKDVHEYKKEQNLLHKEILIITFINIF